MPKFKEKIFITTSNQHLKAIMSAYLLVTYTIIILLKGGIMNTDKFYAQQIANEYAPKEASKVKALKRLDNKVKLPATIFTYTFGIVSSLILGLGMCLAMKVIGGGTALMMAFGIVIGCVGILGASVNYPIYKKWLNTRKNKYANDIITLAKEIADEN